MKAPDHLSKDLKAFWSATVGEYTLENHHLKILQCALEERLRAGTAWEPGEWCFTDEIGAPRRPDGLTLKFVRRVRALGLPGTDIKGLRHAHATALLRAGVHPKVVQERLGHSSISVTMDIHSSVLPGMQREAVEKLAAMMGER